MHDSKNHIVHYSTGIVSIELFDTYSQAHWTSTSSSIKSYWKEMRYLWTWPPKSVLPWSSSRIKG